jgi:type I restriction enzyme S subunit
MISFSLELDFTTLLSGGTPETKIKEYWNGDIKWISGKDITPDDKLLIIKTEKTTTKEVSKRVERKFYPSFQQ